jgi:hypothetical protein
MHGGQAGRKLSDERMADLTRLVGPLPAQVVSAYGAPSPTGVRLAGAAVEVLHPALREGTV